MAIKKIIEVPFVESLNDDDSLFINQNNALVQIAKSDALSNVQTRIDKIDTNIGTINKNINSINTNIDTINTDIDTINTDIDTINTNLNNKAPSSHNHSASNITSGTLSSNILPTVPITKGGTGATTVSNARTNLGLSKALIVQSFDSSTGTLNIISVDSV